MNNEYIVVSRVDGSVEEITAVEIMEAVGCDRWLEEMIENGLPILSESGQEVYIKLL